MAAGADDLPQGSERWELMREMQTAWRTMKQYTNLVQTIGGEENERQLRVATARVKTLLRAIKEEEVEQSQHRHISPARSPSPVAVELLQWNTRKADEAPAGNVTQQPRAATCAETPLPPDPFNASHDPLVTLLFSAPLDLVMADREHAFCREITKALGVPLKHLQVCSAGGSSLCVRIARSAVPGDFPGWVGEISRKLHQSPVRTAIGTVVDAVLLGGSSEAERLTCPGKPTAALHRHSKPLNPSPPPSPRPHTPPPTALDLEYLPEAIPVVPFPRRGPLGSSFEGSSVSIPSRPPIRGGSSGTSSFSEVKHGSLSDRYSARSHPVDPPGPSFTESGGSPSRPPVWVPAVMECFVVQKGGESGGVTYHRRFLFVVGNSWLVFGSGPTAHDNLNPREQVSLSALIEFVELDVLRPLPRNFPPTTGHWFRISTAHTSFMAVAKVRETILEYMQWLSQYHPYVHTGRSAMDTRHWS